MNMRLMHAVIVEYECTNYENWYFNDGDDQYDTCTNFMKKLMIHYVHIKPADEDCVDDELTSIDKSSCDELGIDGYCKNERKYRKAQLVIAVEACCCAAVLL